jgi:hypothetical protein
MTPDDPPADDLLPDDWDEVKVGEIEIAGIRLEALADSVERM